MTHLHTVARLPCGTCPYRRDVPSGVWAAQEYDKLIEYDGPMWLQPQALFLCHQRDGNLCAGWIACHGADNLLAVRLAERVRGNLDLSVFDYQCPVPVFGSGAEAAAHGLRDIAQPGEAARRKMAGLQKIIPQQEDNE